MSVDRGASLLDKNLRSLPWNVLRICDSQGELDSVNSTVQWLHAEFPYEIEDSGNDTDFLKVIVTPTILALRRCKRLYFSNRVQTLMNDSDVLSYLGISSSSNYTLCLCASIADVDRYVYNAGFMFSLSSFLKFRVVDAEDLLELFHARRFSSPVELDIIQDSWFLIIRYPLAGSSRYKTYGGDLFSFCESRRLAGRYTGFVDMQPDNVYPTREAVVSSLSKADNVSNYKVTRLLTDTSVLYAFVGKMDIKESKVVKMDRDTYKCRGGR